MYLLRHWPEAIVHRAGGQNPHRLRSNGLHDRGSCLSFRAGSNAVHRSLCRLRYRRILPRQREARARDLRRSVEARCILSGNFSAIAPSAGTRSISWRCLLPPLTFARAGSEALRPTRWRLAHRASDYRNPGGRRVCVYPDECDFHHRRSNLP